MAYTKTNWVNDSVPAINASNLNKIEQGIYDNAFESGSNANGNYIKFNDGKLICYAKKDVIFSFNSNQKLGSMWESDATSLGSFPYAFYEPPVVNVTNNSGLGSFIEGLLETTTTNIGKMYICRPIDTNSSITYTLSIIAIGRWK
jgi:hypothetical protein